MPARRPLPEGSIEILKAAMKRAKTKEQCRRVLCIWLRVTLGLTSKQTAAALMCSPGHVREAWVRFLEEGEASFNRQGQGGRRRSVLIDREEDRLLRCLREEAWPESVLDFRTVHQAVEKAAGRRVHPSVVHRILVRHGWGRSALVRIAKNKVPRGLTRYAPGPRRTGVWYMLSEEEEKSDPIIQRLSGRAGTDPSNAQN